MMAWIFIAWKWLRGHWQLIAIAVLMVGAYAKGWQDRGWKEGAASVPQLRAEISDLKQDVAQTRKDVAAIADDAARRLAGARKWGAILTKATQRLSGAVADAERRLTDAGAFAAFVLDARHQRLLDAELDAIDRAGAQDRVGGSGPETGAALPEAPAAGGRESRDEILPQPVRAGRGL